MEMRKIGMLMTILMGITMSLILSLVGTALGGHFTLVSWLMSFGISLVISLLIGFIVPIKKLGDNFCEKRKTNPHSFKGTLLSAIISDLIYTPIITIIMVVAMVLMATREIPDMAVRMNIMGHALIPSLIVCFIVGYFVIVLVQPLFLKMLMGKNKPENPEKAD